MTTEATKAQIAALSAKPTKPSWLKLAISDALHGKPMSAKRERRLRLVLGLEASTRTHYYRPCLPVTLTHDQRQRVVAFALELAKSAPDEESA
jgi:hypothetical protein